MIKCNTPCPRPTDPQQRILKGDAALLIQLLKDQGLVVHHHRLDGGGARINAYRAGDPPEYVCGFSWNKGTATDPARWTFDLTLGDVHSWQDLKLLLREFKRVNTQRGYTRRSWLHFMNSKSAKRWSDYLSHLALLFLIRKDNTDA